jgi:outer membrane receptor protein involved in Fe transport
VTGSTGFNLQASENVELFASYGRGFRAPTILEITCSDENDPCPLPFELGADPPIDPVKTDTWQAGLRAQSENGLYGELAAYWAEVYDDIFFVTNAEGIRGFFQNIDNTRRQGIEAAGRWQTERGFSLEASVAFTRATFQSEARLATGLLDLDDDDDEDGGDVDDDLRAGGIVRQAGGEDDGDVDDGGDDDGGSDDGGDNDSDEDEGGEAPLVEPGDEFPITPDVTFHAGVEYRSSDWHLGLSGNYVSSQFLVSDETNSEDFGKIDPYFLVNADASYALGAAEFYLRAENLFDVEYETFGLIARNVRGPDVSAPEAFFTPGEPFRLFGGVRLKVQ